MCVCCVCVKAAAVKIRILYPYLLHWCDYFPASSCVSTPFAVKVGALLISVVMSLCQCEAFDFTSGCCCNNYNCCPDLPRVDYGARHHNLALIDELAHRQVLRSLTIASTITTYHFVGNVFQNPNLHLNSTYGKQFATYGYLN